MISRLIAILATVCVVGLDSTRGGDFQSGAAMRIITPDPLLPVSGGVGEPSAANRKLGELTARAMVFSDGETTIAVVGIDVLGFPSVLGDRVRKLVPRLPRENILIGATHTHSAPDCYGFPLPSGKFTGDLDYMQQVCEKAAEAVNEAIDKIQPATLKIACDKAAERIAYNYYAPQLYDPRMAVIQTLTPDGKVIGTLVNYAVHPEVLGSDAGVTSPDCIGPMCDQIERQLGGIAVFMNGAQGGMVTADNRDFSKPGDPVRGVSPDLRSWDECLRIGHLMASEAERIIGKAAAQAEPVVQNSARQVEFPVESAMMRAIVVGSPLKYPHTDAGDSRIAGIVSAVLEGGAARFQIPPELTAKLRMDETFIYWEGTLSPEEEVLLLAMSDDPEFQAAAREVIFFKKKRATNLQQKDFRISVQINLVTLGNAQILTIPGEALPNIGFYLKRKMKGECNLLFGLTNDAFGYILTKVDFNSFDRYAYVSRTSLGEMTGEILIENAVEMIEATGK